MKQNISLDYVKKFRNNIVKKCNSLAKKIKTGNNVSSIEKFLSLEIYSNGINLISNHKNKKIIVDCLKTCFQVIISESTKKLLSSVITVIDSIEDPQTLKNACEKIYPLINKDISNDLTIESLAISLIRYAYQILCLECSQLCYYYLFPKGDPEYDEIKQGNIGDCYLLAALSSLCKSSEGKKAIKKCFINRKTIDKDGYVTIALFKVKIDIENKGTTFAMDKYGRAHGVKLGQYLARVKTEQNGNIGIKVDKKSINNSFSQGEALWVKFFEQAFEIYRTSNSVTSSSNDDVIKKYIKNWNQNMENMNILDGGTSDIVMTAITGKTSYSILLDKNNDETLSDEYSTKELAIYNTIKKKLDKNLAVTAGMKGKIINEDHMYSVIKVGESTESGDYLKLILFNPHGNKETVGLKDFVKKFSVLNVESSKKV